MQEKVERIDLFGLQALMEASKILMREIPHEIDFKGGKKSGKIIILLRNTL